jgi:hypothetical protein
LIRGNRRGRVHGRWDGKQRRHQSDDGESKNVAHAKPSFAGVDGRATPNKKALVPARQSAFRKRRFAGQAEGSKASTMRYADNVAPPPKTNRRKRAMTRSRQTSLAGRPVSRGRNPINGSSRHIGAIDTLCLRAGLLA